VPKYAVVRRDRAVLVARVAAVSALLVAEDERTDGLGSLGHGFGVEGTIAGGEVAVGAGH
jgi:hypothetical protein